MKNRKSQVKMFETIAILVIFFFLVGIGFIFYSKIKQTSQSTESEEYFSLRAVEIAQLAEFMPEIRCSADIVTNIENCVDVAKLDAMASTGIISQNLDYYYNILGYSVIYLNVVYPDFENPVSWVIYSNPKPAAKDLGKVQTQIPVAVYDSKENKYYFGVLYADFYR